LINRRGQGGGCRARLDDSQKTALRELLAAESHWTTHQIQQLIKEKFAVEYSARQVARLLRQLGLYFYKPL
jgi:transposase